MPIEPIKVEALRVQNLSLGANADGYYISGSCGFAETFVLCFSQHALGRKDLDLTEEELLQLYQGTNGKTLNKGEVRLQGIPQRMFSTSNVFSDFVARPPEQIQLWSMTRVPNGPATLYVPDTPGKETCFVPLRYQYAILPRPNGLTELTVRINGNELSQYQDGALLYQVGDFPEIPIANACINQPLSIRTGGLPLTVQVAAEFKGRYQPIEK